MWLHTTFAFSFKTLADAHCDRYVLEIVLVQEWHVECARLWDTCGWEFLCCISGKAVLVTMGLVMWDCIFWQKSYKIGGKSAKISHVRHRLIIPLFQWVLRGEHWQSGLHDRVQKRQGSWQQGARTPVPMQGSSWDRRGWLQHICSHHLASASNWKVKFKQNHYLKSSHKLIQ